MQRVGIGLFGFDDRDRHAPRIGHRDARDVRQVLTGERDVDAFTLLQRDGRCGCNYRRGLGSRDAGADGPQSDRNNTGDDATRDTHALLNTPSSGAKTLLCSYSFSGPRLRGVSRRAPQAGAAKREGDTARTGGFPTLHYPNNPTTGCAWTNSRG